MPHEYIWKKTWDRARSLYMSDTNVYIHQSVHCKRIYQLYQSIEGFQRNIMWADYSSIDICGYDRKILKILNKYILLVLWNCTKIIWENKIWFQSVKNYGSPKWHKLNLL